MTHAFSSLDELGDGYGFRKIRKALGVEAFGVNAIVFPAHYEGPEHFHDTQDELYFVHKGRIRVDVEGESRELGEGGLFHASSTTRGASRTPATRTRSSSSWAARAATSSATVTS